MKEKQADVSIEDNRPDALQIIINMREKKFREEIILEEVEKELRRTWDGRCRCGHLHSEHGPITSHNYTAGRCKVGECRCAHFIHDPITNKDFKLLAEHNTDIIKELQDLRIQLKEKDEIIAGYAAANQPQPHESIEDREGAGKILYPLELQQIIIEYKAWLESMIPHVKKSLHKQINEKIEGLNKYQFAAAKGERGNDYE